MKLKFWYIWSALLLISLGPVHAQILEPVSWSSSFSKTAIEIGDEVDLVFKAVMDDTWYLYSSDFEEGGPMVSTFSFEENDSYALVGNLRPINPEKKFDDIFEMDVKFFKKKGAFRQTVKILKKDFSIQVNFRGQTCTEVDGRCILVKEKFAFGPDLLKVTEALSPQPEENTSSKENQEENLAKSDVEGKEDEENTDEEAASETATEDRETLGNEEKNPEEVDAAIEETPAKVPGPDETQADQSSDPSSRQTSLLYFLFLAFGGGILAIFMPCIYPLIPMTVTFFTRSRRKRENMSEAEVAALEKQEYRDGIRKALFYGFSIIFIYTALGSVFSAILGPTFANQLSTAAIPNLIYFALFFIFGLSFLGMFELVLPSKWSNAADRQADKGGYYGIFFMALVLATVSFSCTGPIVGSLLVEASTQGLLRPVLGMFAFSLAIAIPFVLFAIFPAWLSNLPQSGGWLNSVKVVLGFLELALAFKFLSIADQVYHWGILDRDVNLAIWVTIFTLMGFYLLGKLQLPNDSKLERVSVPRLLLAILCFSFVVYIIPGLFGAPLKPLAGLLPPSTGQDFNITRLERKVESSDIRLRQIENALNGNGTYLENRENVTLTGNSGPQSARQKAKYSDFLKLPHQLEGFFDYEEGLAYARKVNKPIFIDFTGHGCVNCRLMEEYVWSDERVLERLRNDYVVIALYVDDRTELPESEWVISKYDQETKKNMGEKNADIQIAEFNNNAQPYYCLLGIDENLSMQDNLLVSPPRGYDADVDRFVSFLDQGLSEFKKRQTIAQK